MTDFHNSVCTGCGKPLTSSQRFCPACGTANPGYFPPDPEEKPDGTGEPSQHQKDRKKKKIAGIVLAVVVLSIAVGIGSMWAVVSHEKGQYAEAIEAAEKYLLEEDWKRAEEYYLQAKKIDPKNPEPYIQLARIYMETESFDKLKDLKAEAEQNLKGESLKQFQEEVQKLEEEKKARDEEKQKEAERKKQEEEEKKKQEEEERRQKEEEERLKQEAEQKAEEERQRQEQEAQAAAEAAAAASTLSPDLTGYYYFRAYTGGFNTGLQLNADGTYTGSFSSDAESEEVGLTGKSRLVRAVSDYHGTYSVQNQPNGSTLITFDTVIPDGEPGTGDSTTVTVDPSLRGPSAGDTWQIWPAGTSVSALPASTVSYMETLEELDGSVLSSTLNRAIVIFSNARAGGDYPLYRQHS